MPPGIVVGSWPVLPLGAMFESMALLGSVTAKDQAMSLVWAAAQGHVHV